MNPPENQREVEVPAEAVEQAMIRCSTVTPLERLEGEHETERLALEANCTELEEERDQAAQQERERVKEALESVPRLAISPNGNVLQRPGLGAFVRFADVLTTLDKETD